MGRAEATATKGVDVKARASRAAQLYFDKNSISSQVPRFTCPGCLAAQRRVEEGLAPERARRARTVADLVAVDDRRRDCLAGKWILAVGDSVLRIFFANLLERLSGRHPAQLALCFPDWRVHRHGQCNPNAANMPCVLDLRTATGARLTFVWSFGDGNWKSLRSGRAATAALALQTILADAAPRTPDLLLTSSGAWHPSHSVTGRQRMAVAFIKAMHTLLRQGTSPAASASSTSAASASAAPATSFVPPRCAFVGVPWESERHAANMSGHNALMRTSALEAGCLFIDGMRPCVALNASGRLSWPKSKAKCPDAPSVLGLAPGGYTYGESPEQTSNRPGSDGTPYCCTEAHCWCASSGQCPAKVVPRCGVHAPNTPNDACFYPNFCEGIHAFGLPLAQQVDALLDGICAAGSGGKSGAGSHVGGDGFRGGARVAWTQHRDRRPSNCSTLRAGLTEHHSAWPSCLAWMDEADRTHQC